MTSIVLLLIMVMMMCVVLKGLYNVVTIFVKLFNATFVG